MVAILLLLTFLLATCDSREVRTDQENCERLKEGMSLAEVVAIMGKPKHTQETDVFGPGLYLEYSEGKLASGPLTVQFKGSNDDLRLDYALCYGTP